VAPINLNVSWHQKLTALGQQMLCGGLSVGSVWSKDHFNLDFDTTAQLTNKHIHISTLAVGTIVSSFISRSIKMSTSKSSTCNDSNAKAMVKSQQLPPPDPNPCPFTLPNHLQNAHTNLSVGGL